MIEVSIKSFLGWIWYSDEKNDNLETHKCGKWMYFFDNKDFAVQICENAIAQGICVKAKHTDDDTGVCCFYLNYDNKDGHKRILKYFIDNEHIRKTKTGKLYNISYKLDDQTRAGEYGSDFHALIKLDQFVDLYTGEFI